MRGRRLVTSLTAAAAVFAGGCSSGAEYSPNRPELQESFAATLDLWQGLGVTGLNDLELRTITDGSVTCLDADGNITVTNSSVSPLTFCTSKKTIFVSDLTYGRDEKNYQEDGISPKALAAAGVGHEVGHALIHEAGFMGTDTEKEQLSDCLAGVAVAATVPELRGQANDFFGRIGSDLHGTGEQRQAAFGKGFDGGISACNTALPTMLGIPG
jgi:hypothetical protein